MDASGRPGEVSARVRIFDVQGSRLTKSNLEGNSTLCVAGFSFQSLPADSSFGGFDFYTLLIASPIGNREQNQSAAWSPLRSLHRSNPCFCRRVADQPNQIGKAKSNENSGPELACHYSAQSLAISIWGAHLSHHLNGAKLTRDFNGFAD